MSNTNQVCVTCTQRDTCQYYDQNRTLCVPVKVSDYGQFAGSLQPTIDWQHYRIQASIAAMQAYISDGERMALISKKFDYDDKRITEFIAEGAVMYADALIEKLKGGQDESD